MALINNAKDHWEFLEEIEAPIWVDFLVEAKSSYQDVFHQSRQLKAAFAYSGEKSSSSGFEFRGSFSPKIPSSVSRSRGKHYASKKWGGGGDDLSMNKQHPVKVLSKCLRVNKEPNDKTKPKLSFVDSKGTSRVEIDDENKQLRDRKSSSSKSSVGSSSNPGYDVQSSTLTFKEQTPDSRNVARMIEATRKKIKYSDISNASDIRVKEKVQNQTLRVKALAEHGGNELYPLPGPAKAKAKVRVGGINKLVGPGKENVTGKASLRLNCSSLGTKLIVPQKGDKTVLVRQKSSMDLRGSLSIREDKIMHTEIE
ncbi:hypothetical protein DKX38_025814 [Salix brachista]|uniref:Uncharacterized protein n=1 Tax=Salix brachista TaxID=2182728 RepID=A0A5N5JW04_9ROSI|nr:hypothetical protein DKX38_025814 [Salix brachista]